MPCAKQTFKNVTQKRFECLQKKASGAGIAVNGNAGVATKNGVTLEWTFDPANQTLELQCLAAPLFVSCGTVNGKLHDLVDSCSDRGEVTFEGFAQLAADIQKTIDSSATDGVCHLFKNGKERYTLQLPNSACEYNCNQLNAEDPQGGWTFTWNPLG